MSLRQLLNFLPDTSTGGRSTSRRDCKKASPARPSPLLQDKGPRSIDGATHTGAVSVVLIWRTGGKLVVPRHGSVPVFPRQNGGRAPWAAPHRCSLKAE